jgi:hypothetical protein
MDEPGWKYLPSVCKHYSSSLHLATNVSDLFADSPFPIFTSNYCECHSLVNLAFLLNGQTNGCLVLHHRLNVLEIKAHLVE